MKVEEFPAEVCVTLACCRVGATECGSVCIDLLKEVTIIFITSIIVWSQGKKTEREHSPAYQQQIGLKIY